MYPRKILFTLSVIISFNCFSMNNPYVIDKNTNPNAQANGFPGVLNVGFYDNYARSVVTDDNKLDAFKIEYDEFKKQYKNITTEDKEFMWEKENSLFSEALEIGTNKAIEFVIQEKFRPLDKDFYYKQLHTACLASIQLNFKQNLNCVWGNIKGYMMGAVPMNQNQYNAQIKRTLFIFDCLKKYDPEFNQNMNRSSRSSMCQVLFHRYIKEDHHVDPKVITWIMNNTSNIQTALFSPYKSVSGVFTNTPETKDSFLLSLAKKNFKNYSKKELVDIVISLDSAIKKPIKKEIETVLLCLKHHNITIGGKKDEYVLKNMADDTSDDDISLVTMQYAPRVPLKNVKHILLGYIIDNFDNTTKEMRLAYNETNEYCAHTQNPTTLSEIVRQKPLEWKVFKK